MTHTITLIPGDGIGQEVIPAACAVLESLDLPLIVQEGDAGFGTRAAGCAAAGYARSVRA
jgi:isocitrate/isopropylmalate dehydrogenase